jgi:hypothetical protein
MHDTIFWASVLFDLKKRGQCVKFLANNIGDDLWAGIIRYSAAS